MGWLGGGGGGREAPVVITILPLLASAILAWMDAAAPSLLVLVRGGGHTLTPEGGRHCMKGCWGGLCVQDSDSEVLVLNDSGQSCAREIIQLNF